MMKNFVFSMFAAVFVLTSVPVWALPQINSERPTDTPFMGDAEKSEDIQILDPKDIALLDDAALMEAYINAIVEIDAAKTFHSTSGFTPKQFKKYKNLLKYRLQLLFEANRRKIEIPAEIK